jgi:hypothetical protein
VLGGFNPVGELPVIVDRLIGEVCQAQIFVAVMRLELHLRRGDVDASAWRLDRCPTGGVPSLIVPDNAEVAAIKACYEPQINRTQDGGALRDRRAANMAASAGPDRHQHR